MTTKTKLKQNGLLEILSTLEVAVAVYTGEEINIEWANHTMQLTWGKGKDVIGKTLAELLPELKDQPFVGLLQSVWRTGVDEFGTGVPAELVVDGVLRRFYFDFAYKAVRNERGEVYAILHTATDVTQRVLSNQELIREQAVNEELANANQELFRANEELQRLRDKLKALNLSLEERIEERTLELSLSENRMRYLLSDAPIAIAVLTGPELIIENANKMILEAWGKTETIIGLPLIKALPELASQDYPDIMINVYRTGKAYYGSEAKAILHRNGKLEEVFFNFVYKPLTDQQGEVNGLIITASVVTEQVEARRKVQQLNDELLVANQEMLKSQERVQTLNNELGHG